MACTLLGTGPRAKCALVPCTLRIPHPGLCLCLRAYHLVPTHSTPFSVSARGRRSLRVPHPAPHARRSRTPSHWCDWGAGAVRTRVAMPECNRPMNPFVCARTNNPVHRRLVDRLRTLLNVAPTPVRSHALSKGCLDAVRTPHQWSQFLAKNSAAMLISVARKNVGATVEPATMIGFVPPWIVSWSTG